MSQLALSASFEYKIMLWVYGHYKYFNYVSAGIAFRHQIVMTAML